MYTLAVRRDFIAQHHLIGGEWGPENRPHSHHYVLEVRLTGDNLNEHGYLVDIVQVDQHIADTIARFQERMLNDRPEFAGVNPSLEHFARILALAISDRLVATNLSALEVILWENDAAWAGYSVECAVS